MSSPLHCSSLVSDAGFLLYFQCWAISILLYRRRGLDPRTVLKDLLIVEGIPPPGSKVPWYNCWLHIWTWTFEQGQDKPLETISCSHRQPYSSYSSIVKGLGVWIWIHFVSCFTLMNHVSQAPIEPRNEKSAKGCWCCLNVLQPTWQTPVLRKWMKDPKARQ